VGQKPEQDGPAPPSIELSTVVPDTLGGQRLDAAAAQLFGDFSRARLQDWIRSGELLLDGQRARPRDRVLPGSRLSLSATPSAEVSWQGEELPLDVCYEDEDLLVIDKPAGVVVHPGAGNPRGTLVNALLAHRPALNALPRGGIVHRLDKDTSGLLVVAASERAHRSLVDQLQSKTAQREYLAVARGHLSGGGSIDAPVGRHPQHRTRMAVVERGGKAALTHYRIHERFEHYTALAVHLETGRTHQIRVHLAHRGYPLVGDPVYGGRLQLPAGVDEELRDVLRRFPRQALHARRLAFVHPADGELREFTSPLPRDIEALLGALRRFDAPGGGRDGR
jgi:23S rRNA pseudouridine1911/1915/1917 synthase